MEIVKFRNSKTDYIFTLGAEGGGLLIQSLNIIDSIDSSIFLLPDIYFSNTSSFIQYSSNIVAAANKVGPDFLVDFGSYQRGASRHLMAVLTSFFSFIEVTPKLIQHELNDEITGKFFSKLITQYENEYFEFRFIRKFRNYVQHNNIPIRNLDMTFFINRSNPLIGIIELNRSELLQHGKWKNKDDKYNLEEELAVMSSNIILEPIIFKLNECVLEIVNKIIDKIVAKYEGHIMSLFRLYDDARAKCNDDQIAVMIPDAQNNKTDIRYFNITCIKRLQQMYEAFEENGTTKSPET